MWANGQTGNPRNWQQPIHHPPPQNRTLIVSIIPFPLPPPSSFSSTTKLGLPSSAAALTEVIPQILFDVYRLPVKLFRSTGFIGQIGRKTHAVMDEPSMHASM